MLRNNFTFALSKLSLICLAVPIFTGCIGRQAYYLSPFNGQHNTYHSIPLHSDSVRSGTYLNAAIISGSANEGRNDYKLSFAGGISRGHNFGNFQAYYAAMFTAGNYRLRPYDSIGNNYSVDHWIINENAGNYFFGGAGVDAGINFVVSNPKAEWRLGWEASAQHEFGNYIKARQRIPDSAATLIVRDRLFGTTGFFAEFIGTTGRSEIGTKLGWGTVLGKNYRQLNFPDSYFYSEPPRFNYFNLTFHLTVQKWTGFLQACFAEKAGSNAVGINYRIGK